MSWWWPFVLSGVMLMTSPFIWLFLYQQLSAGYSGMDSHTLAWWSDLANYAYGAASLMAAPYPAALAVTLRFQECGLDKWAPGIPIALGGAGLLTAFLLPLAVPLPRQTRPGNAQFDLSSRWKGTLTVRTLAPSIAHLAFLFVSFVIIGLASLADGC